MATDDTQEAAAVQGRAAGPVEIAIAKLHTDIGRRFDTLDADLALVSHEISVLQGWREEVENRLKSNSMRASSASVVDASHEAKLAVEAQRRIALEKQHAETHALATQAAAEAKEAKEEARAGKVETQAQTLMLKRITDLLDTPMVKRIGYAAGALLVALLSLATGYLSHGGRP